MLRARRIIGVAALAALVAVVSSATAGQQAASAGQGYKVVAKWGKAGTANGQFVNANGIAVDKGGNVYVADSDNHRIQVFSASGKFVRKWGSHGGGNGQFDIAEDEGDIFGLADRTYRVSGDTSIERVNEAFGVKLVSDEFDTIGGLIAHEMGHVPRRGEQTTLEGLDFVVLHTKGGAVRWFKVSPARTEGSKA